MWGSVAQRLADHMAQCERDKRELKERAEKYHAENTQRLADLAKSVDRLLTVTDVNVGRESERESHRRDKVSRYTIYATLFAGLIALYADKMFKFLEPK